MSLTTDDLTELERQIETGTIFASLDTFAELVRVYRGAQGDRSLAARMHRETRIETLELKPKKRVPHLQGTP